MDSFNDFVFRAEGGMDHGGHNHTEGGDGGDGGDGGHDGHNSTDSMPKKTAAPMRGGDSNRGSDSTEGGHGNHGGESSETQQASGAASTNTAHGGSEHGMKPYLFSDSTGFFVLFREAFVNNTGGFIGALIATCAFGFITTVGFEIGKRFETAARNSRAEGGSGSIVKALIGSVAHALRLLLHYIAMLLVMTMNIWIILAVLVGHALGFLVAVIFLKQTVSAKASANGGCDC